MATRAQKRTNIVVARVVPPVLLGIVTYASYAITKPLCSEPPPKLQAHEPVPGRTWIVTGLCLVRS